MITVCYSRSMALLETAYVQFQLEKHNSDLQLTLSYLPIPSPATASDTAFYQVTNTTSVRTLYVPFNTYCPCQLHMVPYLSLRLRPEVSGGKRVKKCIKKVLTSLLFKGICMIIFTTVK